MPKPDIVRAWKDEEYRESLSPFLRAQLPDNPAGIVELSDQDMGQAGGGTLSLTLCDTFIYCSYITFCPMITFTIAAEQQS